jgi:hypothetical protein
MPESQRRAERAEEASDAYEKERDWLEDKLRQAEAERDRAVEALREAIAASYKGEYLTEKHGDLREALEGIEFMANQYQANEYARLKAELSDALREIQRRARVALAATQHPDPEAGKISFDEGAYSMCKLLLTSPRFNRPQREIIEEQALEVKERLEKAGVSFDGRAAHPERARAMRECIYCGSWHEGICPRIAEIEYWPNGGVKRVRLQGWETSHYPTPCESSARESPIPSGMPRSQGV